jgi:hypothetical protein
MRTSLVVLLVAGGLGAVTPPVHANHVLVGTTCGFWSVTNLVVEADTQSGFMTGAANATVTPATVTVTCTIQVGSANSTHAGADSATSQESGSQAASVSSPIPGYTWSSPLPVYVCTQWDVTLTSGSTTYYYDAANLGFSTSSAVGCETGNSLTIGPVTYQDAPQTPADV